MDFYSMEQLEIGGDILEEILADSILEDEDASEWADFEIDMDTNPYDDPFFTR